MSFSGWGVRNGVPFTNTNDEADDEELFLQKSNVSPTPITAIPVKPRDCGNSSSDLSGSVGHRIPARSFAHGSFGSAEPFHFSSHGVRDQTQQLASWGLERSSSSTRMTSTGVVPSGLDIEGSPSGGATSARGDSEHGVRELGGHNYSVSMESSQPEAIVETSKPPPPEDTPVDSHIQDGMEEPDVVLPTIGVLDDNDPDHDERTPLLPRPIGTFKPPYKDSGEAERQAKGLSSVIHRMRSRVASAWRVTSHPKTWSPKAVGRGALHGGTAVIAALPAVFLGWLLNVLDALSYGTILFPLGEPIFAETGPDGIAIFFVSTVIAQLVYSCLSKFKGGVGSEMIEVVPFFHKMAYLVMARMGAAASGDAVMATVYVSYIVSSILTGTIFLLLGAFKLGNLVSFFPRSILTGCIGGVGVFLFITGIEVSAGITGNLDYSLATMQALLAPDTLPLWTVPLLLAVILFVIKLFSERPIIVPAFFIAIIAVFYIVVAAVPYLSLEDLRDKGWVFEKPQTGVAFYHFYKFYNLKIVDWGAIAQCFPTMLALSFFGIIHVPINVPALALAVQEDNISTNRELINHGLSNTISGFAGSIQNYLVYANSQMFIKNGGNSRLCGFLLAIATLATWMAGPESIGYIPKMIVGTLIYLLGIDLVKEALWDTFGRICKLEYLMIFVIVVIMGFYDFVVGIGVGIVLSSLIFVVQTSQVSAVRAVFSGSIAKSTVRRHPVHRRFLNQVGSQLRVFKLAGYLFFGTIVDVEKKVRHLVEEEEFSRQPIRFLVVDFKHVTGLDFSAAEAFCRLRRLLSNKGVAMMLSGISTTGGTGQSLAMVGLFNADEENENDFPPRVYEDLNKALEACENDQLIAFKARSDALTFSTPIPTPVSSLAPQRSPLDAQFNTPRRTYLRNAAEATIKSDDVMPPSKWNGLGQPLLLILQTFRNLSDKDIDFWYRASQYFKRVSFAQGQVLYSAGDSPNGFYILEEGFLTATYDMEQGSYQENIVAGTTCGELPFFAAVERSATVVAERDCLAWQLDKASWERLGREWGEGERELLRLGLKLTAERMNAVTSYVLVTASY